MKSGQLKSLAAQWEWWSGCGQTTDVHTHLTISTLKLCKRLNSMKNLERKREEDDRRGGGEEKRREEDRRCGVKNVVVTRAKLLIPH